MSLGWIILILNNHEIHEIKKPFDKLLFLVLSLSTQNLNLAFLEFFKTDINSSYTQRNINDV